MKCRVALYKGISYYDFLGILFHSHTYIYDPDPELEMITVLTVSACQYACATSLENQSKWSISMCNEGSEDLGMVRLSFCPGHTVTRKCSILEQGLESVRVIQEAGVMTYCEEFEIYSPRSHVQSYSLYSL